MTIELKPQLKKKLIVFPQDKGGIGKSLIATLLYDYLTEQSVKLKTFDLDHGNSTFQRFVPEARPTDEKPAATARSQSGTDPAGAQHRAVRGGIHRRRTHRRMSRIFLFFTLIITAMALAFIALSYELWVLLLAPAAAWFAFLTFVRDEAEEWKYVLTLSYWTK